MKSFYLVLLTFLLCNNIKGQIKNYTDSVQILKYTSFTRGGNIELVLSKKGIIYNEKGFDSIYFFKAMDKHQWSELIKTISNINLSLIKDIEAPTNERASDGAWHDQVTFITNKNAYTTQYFDRGKPMLEILPIIQQLQELICIRIL